MSPSGKVYGLRCCKVRRTSSAIELLEPRCLLSGGDPDLTWGGGDGFVTFDSPGADYMWDEPSAMALADDGKMILTGSTQNSNQGRYYATIARVNPDGTLDPTFGNGGMINFRPDTDVFVNAEALAPDGEIVLAGHIMVPYLNGTTPSSQDLLVMRFNSDGSIDTSFGGGDGMFSRDIGASEVDDAKAVAVQPDGKIIVEGSGHGRDYVFTLRLDVDGNLDPSFAGSGIILQKGLAGAQSGGDMILDPDGNIVVAATTNSVYDTSSYTRLLLLRYLPTGALDNSFDGDGK